MDYARWMGHMQDATNHPRSHNRHPGNAQPVDRGLEADNRLGRNCVTADDLSRLETILLDHIQLAALSTDIAAALGQTSNLSEILEQCLHVMVERLCGVVFVRIWTFNQETHLLELRAIAGQHSPTENFPSRIPLSISIIGFIAQSRKPYVTNAVVNDVVIGTKEWIQQEGIVAFAGYPLIVEDQLVGVMALFSRQSITSLVQNTLGALANNIAIAIDRVKARDELVTGREALLFRLANQIRKSLQVDKVLGNAVHEIRALLRIDRCHFLWYLPQPDRAILSVTHEAKAPELSSMIGEYPVEQVEPLYEKVLSLQMIRTNYAVADAALDEPTRLLLLDLGVASQLLLPLETRSGRLGAIVCNHCSSRTWTDSEVELLQAVVAQLALAIDQAELYAQSRAVAQAAQTQAQQLSETLHHLKQTQIQLIQSEKMSSLGQMVAGIAHEINNPISFITGNLSHASNYIQDLLKLVGLYQSHALSATPEIQAWADEIDLGFIVTDLPKLLSSMRIGADRIRQIVLSLRNFSRLDEAEMKPVDIHEGIDNTLLILQNRLKPTALSPGIEIVKEYGTLPAVECYAGQLNQVFMNVLSNAIDALVSRYPEQALEDAGNQEDAGTRGHWDAGNQA
ncbi:MAG: GAF domain-containing protein, partial [Leptolyngbyaceae cyanobacterium RU_5_1]|nr:GAF domain-containing protein [Leptolyngbyaceae cyanobacterium RU_5_1]